MARRLQDARKPGIDDVRFLTALADKFIGEIGADRNRVFGVGLSEGPTWRFASHVKREACYSASSRIQESFQHARRRNTVRT